MTAYRYIAINNQGKRQKGSIEADSERQVRQWLCEQGLSALRISIINENPINTTRSWSSILNYFSRQKRLTSRDLALITRQLAVLLQAGIAIDAAIASIAKQSEKSYIQSILLGVRSQVCEGRSLANALAAFPKSFPKLYQATVAAGEHTGNLETILLQLADYIDRSHRLSQKVLQALLYPSIMSVVALSVVTFLLMTIVPKIITVFTQTQQTLPFATTLLIQMSHFIQHDGWFVLFAGFFCGVLIKRALQRSHIRFAFDRFILKLPLLGKCITLINTTRFAHTLSILSTAHLPILECLQVATELIKPLPMQQAITKAIEQIREGSTLHQALQKTGYFTPLFLHLLASGESSGELGTLLQSAATQQQHDIEMILQNTLTLFEPILILVIGGIVLFIVLAIMLPIFNMDTLF